ncbi:hypothetical protein CPB86DRAFT_192425 [Serendipita vermifera]|nr:hypothetical protein CPB86DRAFT_192425 [Serendipita vermifera]
MTPLGWKSISFISGLAIGGLLAPSLEALLPRWPFEQMLLWSRISQFGSLLFIICEPYEFPRTFWTLGLKRFDENVNWQPTAIRFKRFLCACSPSQVLTRRKVPYLPPEIWEIILAFVIHVPFVLDTSCDMGTSLHFFPSQSYLSEVSLTSYRVSEIRKRRLRLVCRMWKDILEGRPQRWVHEGLNLKDNTDGMERIERIDFLLTDHWVDAQWFPQARGEVYALLETPEDLVSLTNICINDTTGRSDEHTTGISNLFYRISRIPNLRALNYTHRHGSIKFLSQLQTYFSSITSLHIETEVVHGSLHLENLQTLYLDVARYEVGEWSLPSLRHCAIGRGVKYFTFCPDADEKCPIVLSSLYKLQSLLFYNPPGLRITKYFWIAYPSLECFGGGGCWGIDIIDHPPFDHPVRQFVYTDLRPPLWGPPKHLASLPKQIRRVYIAFSRHKSPFLDPNTAWAHLIRGHHQKGVVWLDRDGMEIRYKQVVVKDQATAIFYRVGWLYISLYSLIDLLFCITTGGLWVPFPFHETIAWPITFIGLAIWWSIACIRTRFISPRYVWARDI